MLSFVDRHADTVSMEYRDRYEYLCDRLAGGGRWHGKRILPGRMVGVNVGFVAGITSASSMSWLIQRFTGRYIVRNYASSILILLPAWVADPYKYVDELC